jgi:hypothetical protein
MRFRASHTAIFVRFKARDSHPAKANDTNAERNAPAYRRRSAFATFDGYVKSHADLVVPFGFDQLD